MIPNSKEHRIPVIYKITNLINGKIYIGSAVSFYRRYNIHKHYGNPPRVARQYICKAMQKYGFYNFQFEIIEKVEDKATLINREQFWIDHFQPYKKEIGYNLNPTAGSWLGRKHTPESIKKMSDIRIGIPRNLTPEQRKKISEKAIENSKNNPVFKQKSVVQIDFDTLKQIAIYPSIKDASVSTGLGAKQISKACCRNGASEGYFWVYADKYNPNTFSRPEKTNGKRVCQLALDGSVLKIWRNAFQAAHSININVQNIYGYLSGRVKTSHNFLWRYAEQNE